MQKCVQCVLVFGRCLELLEYESESGIMPQSEVEQTVWLCRLHSASYEWLAGQCLIEGRLLYKIRPKTHYFCHMVDHHEMTKICLMHLATFGDEHYMGKTRNICQSCHGGTYMMTWARRYAVKRALQWKQMMSEAKEKGFMRGVQAMAVHEHVFYSFFRSMYGTNMGMILLKIKRW